MALSKITNDGIDNITIDASGNVGINETSPDSLLHIASTSNPTISLEDTDNGFDATQLQVQNGGRDFMVDAPQDIIIKQGGSEIARFLSGEGLTFNGDTAAANALDDYEEGTFTITVSNGVTSPTYTNQQGSYVKIGRCVTFRAYLNLLTGTANASAFILDGLPFTSANEARYGGAFFNFNGGFYTSNEITAHIPQNSTTIEFYATDGNGLSGNSINSGGNILAQVILQGFYYV